MSAEGRLLVRQTRGNAGRPWTQLLVLKGLGLRGPGSEVTVDNARAIRGMIRKVLHLVTVEEVGVASAQPTGAGAKKAAAAAPAAKTPAAKAPAAKKVSAAAKPAASAAKKGKS
jgi:large subunit ribosomal protein L30